MSATNFSGSTKKKRKKIMRDTDIIINGAGNVTFNPPLESALRTNVVGSNNIIKMARMMKKPRLVHVSTCFVAGKRSGPIWENEPVVGYFPRKNELVGTTFDVNREVEDCARLSEQARQEADDAVQIAKFRELARRPVYRRRPRSGRRSGTEIGDLSRTQNVDPRADDRARGRACRVLGLDEYLHVFEIACRADHRPAGRHR